MDLKYESKEEHKSIKYKTIDDKFFKTVDTEFKAYLLGWIAQIGHVTESVISIFVKNSDEEIIAVLRDGFCKEIPLNHYDDKVGFKIYSTEICDDVYKIFGQKAKAKFQFPDIIKSLKWVFIRGLMDCDGTINKNEKRRGCAISSCSIFMKEGVGNFCNIKHFINEKVIGFSGTNSVDFLSKIYDSTSDETLRLKRKYILYLEQLMYKPIPKCYFVKTRKDAITPSKRNCSDEGYDLWLIDIDKKIDEKTIRYETFIKIQPEDGWHIEILARSSLSNSGYILTNSVGLIDSSYRGTLKVTLTKVNNNSEDIKFPFKAVQMVLRKNVHFLCEEVEDIDNTERGEGGFGSTDTATTIF